MGREELLSLLIVMLGGFVLQLSAALPRHVDRREHSAGLRERMLWFRLWYPIVPLLIVAAGLCGWALTEPDPVPDRLGTWPLMAVWAPFALIFGRAAARAAWAVLRRPRERGVSTIGFIQPQVVFSPFLARELDEGMIRAILEHERAHARHRDPLRIWLAQLASDLQWPWPGARQRFEQWIDALEQARAEHLPGVAEQRRRAVAVQQLIAGQDHLPQQEHGEPVGDNLAPDRRVTAVAGHHLLDPAGAVIGPRQQPAGLPAVTGKPGQPVKDPLRPALPLGVAAGRAR